MQATENEAKLVSIPEGAIEGGKKIIEQHLTKEFQYPKVRLKVEALNAIAQAINVSIPEGAIEGTNLKVQYTRFQNVSIPEGAIEGIPWYFLVDGVALFQYPKVRLKA